MPTLRRVEDKIRSLCEQILAAKDDEIELIIVELRHALHRHTEGLRARLAEYPRVSERRAR